MIPPRHQDMPPMLRDDPASGGPHSLFRIDPITGMDGWEFRERTRLWLARVLALSPEEIRVMVTRLGTDSRSSDSSLGVT